MSKKKSVVERRLALLDGASGFRERSLEMVERGRRGVELRRASRVEKAVAGVRRGVRGKVHVRGTVRRKDRVRVTVFDRVRAYPVKLDGVIGEMLSVMAVERGVHRSVLMADVLVLWMGAVAEYESEIWKRMFGGLTVPDVPERYMGYLGSLGYLPGSECEVVREPVEMVVELPVGVEECVRMPRVGEGGYGG